MKTWHWIMVLVGILWFLTQHSDQGRSSGPVVVMLTPNITGRVGMLTGVNTHGSWESNHTHIDKNNVEWINSNSTWHRETLLASGIKQLRGDVSLGSTFWGCPNCGAEYWNWTTGGADLLRITEYSFNNMPQGWRFGLYGTGAVGTIAQSTDHVEGQYAAQVTSVAGNCTGTNGCNAFSFNDIQLPGEHTYTITVQMKTTNSVSGVYIQNTNDLYKDICVGSPILHTGSGNWETITCTTPNLTKNTNTYRVVIYTNGVGHTMLWDDFHIYQDDLPFIPSHDIFGGISHTLSSTEWACAHNKTELWIVSYMPVALANIDMAVCNVEGSTRCPPNNYAEYSLWVRRWFNATSNHGQYLPCMEIEVWNEPDIAFWMDKLAGSDMVKIQEYMKLYNATYDGLKADWPTLKIGGPSTCCSGSNLPKWWGAFFNNTMADANSSVKYDFISYHSYSDAGDPMYNFFRRRITELMGNCTSAHVPCNKVYMDEVGTHHPPELVNQSGWLGNQWLATYLWVLNNYPENITIAPYQWSSSYMYELNGPTTKNNGVPIYDEYPHRFSLVSEPGLDHSDASYYAVYNVTRMVNAYAPEGADILMTNNTGNYTVTTLIQNGTHYALFVANTGFGTDVVLTFSPLFHDVSSVTVHQELVNDRLSPVSVKVTNGLSDPIPIELFGNRIITFDRLNATPPVPDPCVDDACKPTRLCYRCLDESPYSDVVSTVAQCSDANMTSHPLTTNESCSPTIKDDPVIPPVGPTTWYWYVGGGIVLVALILPALTKKRRRRR